MNCSRVGEGTFNGKSLRVCFFPVHTEESAILGCHSRAIQYFGKIYITGIQYGDLVAGVIHPDSTLANPTTTITKIPEGWDLTSQAVQDVIYARHLKHYSKIGVVLFSDRVNRGTLASPPKEIGRLGNTVFSCAALGAWIAKHPEVGSIYASPFMNNPNYRTGGNYGICQVFMYFPPTTALFTDETLGPIGPDVRLTRENFLKNGTIWNGKYTKDLDPIYVPGLPKGYDKITYDGE